MNTMKKLMAVMAALLLAMGCLPAAAEDLSSQLADIWIENDGWGTLTLFESGTAVMQYSDDMTMSCTWAVTEDGARFLDGMWYNSPMELIGENTLSINDGWMTFTRAGTEVEEIPLESVPVGEEGEPFLGTWSLSVINIEGSTFNAADFGMSMEFTFYADGTVTSLEDGETNTSFWSVEYGAAMVDGLFLTLNEEGQLVLTEEGSEMIFVQGGAVSSSELSEEEQLLALLALMAQQDDGSTDLPAATDVPAAAPAGAAAPVFTSHEDYLDRKFVATSYSMMGQTFDASTLGAEYSLLFRANGSCDFCVAGTLLPNLSWGLGNVAVGLNQVEAFSINYYGTVFNAVPTSTGFDLDYYGTMTLHFVRAE